MNSKLLLICFAFRILAPTESHAQHADSTHRSLQLEANIVGLGVAFAQPGNARPALTRESEIVPNNLHTTGFQLNLPELHVLFKDHVGVTLGISFTQFNLNDQVVRADFPATVDGYQVNLDSKKPDGLSSVSGSLGLLSFEPGVMGKVGWKHISILPFCSWSFCPGRNRYNVDANLSAADDSDILIRNYTIHEKVRRSWQVGADLRYNFDIPAYLGLRASYKSCYIDGSSRQTDYDQEYNTLSKAVETYNRSVNMVAVQIFMGWQFGKKGFNTDLDR